MDIKQTIKDKNLRQWEVAELAGTNEFTLSRWLRKPESLSQDKRQRIQRAIEKLLNSRVI